MILQRKAGPWLRGGLQAAGGRESKRKVVGLWLGQDASSLATGEAGSMAQGRRAGRFGLMTPRSSVKEEECRVLGRDRRSMK